MRHLCKVDHESLAADVLAERKRERRRTFSESLALQNLLEANGFTNGIRHLQTDEARVRNARHNTHGLNAERAPKVVTHIVYLRSLYARPWLKPILRDDWTGLNTANRGFNAVTLKFGNDETSRHLEIVGAVGLPMLRRFIKKRHAERARDRPDGFGSNLHTFSSRPQRRARTLGTSGRHDDVGDRSRGPITRLHNRHDAGSGIDLRFILAHEHLLASLRPEKLRHRIKNAAADEAPDALGDVLPLKIHQERQADGNKRSEKHSGKADANIVPNPPGQAVAQNATGLTRQNHLKPTQTQSLQTG